MKKINIAIDGLSSTGKSTLAKQLAERLSYTYVDSGAMYRAISLAILNNSIELNDSESLLQLLNSIELKFVNNQICLNGEHVEQDIRSMKVSDIVSQVAAIPQVRDYCVEIQKSFGQANGVVMDGRDIGTVVFPDAALKIFLYASADVRTDRRWAELKAKGLDISRERVEENLMARDKIDTSREYNPLRKAEDAVEFDNSTLSLEDQLEIIITWVEDRTKSEKIE